LQIFEENRVLTYGFQIMHYVKLAKTFATVSPIAEGVGLIVTPNSLSMATFSAALSPAEEIIAPA
jgi:hypothetical protein